MTLDELFTLLNSITGFEGKVAYEAFPTDDPLNPVPSLPFICFIETDSNNFGADNKTFFKVKRVQIELYSKLKDTNSELLIENALDGANIYYETSDTYLEDEKCHERIYEIEV